MLLSMFYLAHISDIHLAPLPNPSVAELFGKRLTGYMNWKKNRQTNMGIETLNALMLNLKAKKPHHLLISGDLVNLSLDDEFSQARQWLLKQGSPNDISLTFGNHDAYVRGSFDKACNIFSPWIKGDLQTSWNDAFPFMRIRDNVAIISASSAIATPPFQASGYFGSKQKEHLATLLNEATEKKFFRVVMIHHPPFRKATYWHKKLWGIQRFQTTIQNQGADLILHGHTHLPTLHYIQGKKRKIPVVGVSSASQSFSGHKPPANYNWFSISRQNDKWKCKLQRYTIINTNNEIECTEEDILY
ncbi:metallophosphoesterase family protein [Bartonella tamiae]|uniref:Calcineurin-like phosphoesterase domain-containing protein n=1 Tax=Bartonella tamiae Th239 TaxID=1094558 RepID=J0R0Z9_9HYPH|nr:metallophosphoesterase [Bartonella tamiae]EJF89219.1 hypothetical protein ME5_01770 [Bartonella tamiae Th239]EJF95377.1 hypothetical protein MEG_00110 [Bartonella tamiae Th307]